MTQSCSAVKSVTIEETISLKLPENRFVCEVFNLLVIDASELTAITIVVAAEASRSPKKSQIYECHKVYIIVLICCTTNPHLIPSTLCRYVR